ncbi:MAG: sensor histidine kinase [Candidatus Cryptobacteroides sp.]
MPLRLFITAVLLLFSCSLVLYAKDNGISLCPECQAMYEKVDEAVGKSSFDSLNCQFHILALEHKDKNAELQYYLLELRHRCRGSSKEQVLEAMENLKVKALELGELKYFFNAYTRAAMYMTDIEKDEIGVMELISKMLIEAQNYNSEYGFYEGNRYLALIYWGKGDFINSRKYALEAYRIYTHTTDPIIKNETVIIRTLLELSETYKVDNDSSRIFLEEARKVAAAPIDSFRCAYHEARYLAKKKDMKGYAVLRDSVRRSERYYKRYYPQGDLMFEATEAAAGGNWSKFRENVRQFNTVMDLKYFSELAYIYGNNLELANVEAQLLDIIYESLSKSHSNEVDKLAAMMGNKELSYNLNETEEKLEHSNKMVITFLSACLLLFAFFSAIYAIHNYKETVEKEKLIVQLRQSKDEAETANRMKTAFVQNMSHEIRTPLNALVGFSQLLSLPDGSLTAKEKEEYAEIVSNSGDVLTGLIDDILSLADIESGNYKITLTTLKPASVCNFAMIIVEGRVKPEVKLVFDNQVPDNLIIKSDILRIQQILTNFLTNASKNTEKGSITLGCTTEEHPGFVTFYVADTGIGVPPDKAEEIFGRYVKLDSFKPGTGLGLCICRSLAEKLGGKVYLDQNYSPGARFVLDIPASE